MKFCPQIALYTDDFVALLVKNDFPSKQDHIGLSWSISCIIFSKRYGESLSFLSAYLDYDIERSLAIALI